MPAPIFDLILKRWSPRAFSERDVSPADLRTLLEAAHWAASSFNEQPWRFIVGPKSDEETHGRILATLVEKNREWAKAASVLMLMAAKRTFTHNRTPNYYGLHDTGAALTTLMLQATTMGISVHAMAGFDREKARETFHIPADFDLGAAVAIGYLPEGMSAPATRTRKPLEELVFGGEWGKAAEL